VDVLIDTDPGMGTLGSEPEDSLAITMAFVSPEVTVRAITCVKAMFRFVTPTPTWHIC
jgi:inosine-uridine nucleoside N-ribohydrolase